MQHEIEDQYCPHVHESQISAACYEPFSQVKVTADRTGVVSVFRASNLRPFFTVKVNGAVDGALSVSTGGKYLGVGDDTGSLHVYDLEYQQLLFEESREGSRGLSRAFRALSFTPTGALLAAISVDGILRIWNLTDGTRNAYQGFTGGSLEFDRRGERLLIIGEDNQPKLFDIYHGELLQLERSPSRIEHARFSRDGQYIVASGPGGFIVYQVSTFRQIMYLAAQRSSGFVDLCVHPVENLFAAVSRNSVHVFQIPSLDRVDYFKHNAEGIGNSAIWDSQDIWIGANDGLLHSRSQNVGTPPTHLVASCGDFLIGAHSQYVSVWHQGQRLHYFPLNSVPCAVDISRDGKLVIAAYLDRPFEVYFVQRQECILTGHAGTESPIAIHISTSIACVEISDGGVYWWSLTTAHSMQLRWARNTRLTGGGTWLAVVTPAGRIQVMDPQNGQKALPDPKAMSSTPIHRVAFAGQSSLMFALDEEGYLVRYDLSQSGLRGAVGEDVLQINAPVDQIWAIHGGDRVYLRIIPADDGPKLIVIDVGRKELIAVINAPDTFAVNPDGRIYRPGKSSAIVELVVNVPDNFEVQTVNRCLPNYEWISFSERTILAASDGASQFLT